MGWRGSPQAQHGPTTAGWRWDGGSGFPEMPTATLTFTLPDENMDHRAAIAGVDALIALEKIDQRLRSVLKHGEPSRETGQLAKEIRQMIPAELLEILE